jgi:phenylalanyl-tRNA synthetase beta chain
VKISYNWLKELVDLSSISSPQDLADLLTERGLEVEEIARQDQGLEMVITAEILEKGKHPDSDRLSLCKIKTGKKVGGTDEILEVVCGATNHKTGDKIALAQVGASLPNGMKIGKGKIRGVESFGMLCSETELGLAKESQGIIILPAQTPIGKPIAEILGKNDTIFTLKLYANQGHFLSHSGVARELAAALSLRAAGETAMSSLKVPMSTVKLDWKNSPITVELKAGDLAPQFFGVLIEGVKVGPSPVSVVTRLQACGLRSINNVVDATNLLLMELGHPVHAYDADKISGKKIGVRLSTKGEKLPLLDGSAITLDGSELVIFDGAQAIGLAGVMGGGNSEVTEKTTRVFLECAQFDPVTVRKAKTLHQKQTDAAHRFERGVDPQGLASVISRLTTLVIELAGGKVIGSVQAQLKSPSASVAIEFPYDYAKNFLGLSISSSEVEKIFTSLEFKFEKGVDKEGGFWKVTPPSYRLDLKIRQDLAEEVARSVGYDKIPNEIPPLTSAPTPKAFSPAGAESMLMDRAKDSLVKQGLCEAINYAFTSQSWLDTFGLKAQAQVINPLSEEHEFLVPSLLPGLIQNAVTNFRHHFGSEKLSVRLFEVRPTFVFSGSGQPSMLSETETGVQENWKVSMLVTGTRYQQALRAEAGEFDFYDMKAMVESFLESMGTKGVRLIAPEQSRNAMHPTLKLLHPGQSIEVLVGNATLGHFGLLHPKLAKSLKLKGSVYLAELDWASLVKMSRAASQARTYRPWSEFPGMERDFAFVVDQAVSAEKILGVLNKVGKPLVRLAKIFDVYQGSQVPVGKRSVAARVILQDDTRSLTEAEAEEMSKKLVSALQKELSAELR